MDEQLENYSRALHSSGRDKDESSSSSSKKSVVGGEVSKRTSPSASASFGKKSSVAIPTSFAMKLNKMIDSESKKERDDAIALAAAWCEGLDDDYWDD